MGSWLTMLGGLIVWAAHFFAVYAVGSVLPGTAAARVLTGLITLVCLTAAGLFLLRALRCPSGLARSMGAAGGGLAAIGIVWQGLPALFA